MIRRDPLLFYVESAGCYFDRLGAPVVLLTVDDAILCVVCVAVVC